MISSISSNDYDDLRMGRHGPEEYLRPFYVQRQDGVDRVITNDDPLVQRPSGYSQINFMQKILFVPNDRCFHHYEKRLDTLPRFCLVASNLSGRKH